MNNFLSAIDSLTDSDLSFAIKTLVEERQERTKATLAKRPEVGAKVRILRGKEKYEGQVGTAVVVRKTRCFVQVPGIDSPAYVLTSDLEIV